MRTSSHDGYERLGGGGDLACADPRISSPQAIAGCDSDRRSSDEAGGAVILLVEDDAATLEFFRRTLEHAGFTVRTSTTGQSAIDLARRDTIDLTIVDLKLPDMSGLDVVRRAVVMGARKPFLLVSSFLATNVTVDAMRLGAHDVLEKPVSVERLLAAVRACLHKAAREGPQPIPLAHVDRHRRSAAHRWATYVIKACESDVDLKTLDDWAHWTGVSYSSLCESCRIIGIQPHLARDFTRTLRAVIKSAVYRCEPSVLLDVSDRRTLRALLQRAGPFFRRGGATSVPQFVQHQRFIPSSNEGIRIVLAYFEAA